MTVQAASPGSRSSDRRGTGNTRADDEVVASYTIPHSEQSLSKSEKFPVFSDPFTSQEQSVAFILRSLHSTRNCTRGLAFEVHRQNNYTGSASSSFDINLAPIHDSSF